MLELQQKNVDLVSMEYWVYFCIILYDVLFPWDVEPTTVDYQIYNLNMKYLLTICKTMWTPIHLMQTQSVKYNFLIIM